MWRPQIKPNDLEYTINIVNNKAIERLNKKGWGIYISKHEALGIIAEEYQELIESIRDDNTDNFYEECLDIAVAAILAIASKEK